MLIKNINKLLYILLIVIIVLLIALSTIVIVYFFRKSSSRNGLYRKDECIVNYSDIIKKNSIKYKVDENLIYAIIMTESSFNKDAVSKAGAIGLMQLMPDTYEDIKGKLGYDQPAETALRDPEINISCGVYYFVT